MPGLTYSQFVTQVAQLAVVQQTDANFLAILPMAIQYAELRIARDVNPMNYSVALSGDQYILNAGNRNIQFPQNLVGVSNDGTDLGGASFVVSEQINLILPSQTRSADTGDRVPLTPVTKEFLDAVYGSPSPANRGLPEYYAAFNETLFFVGPVPDQDYYLEIVGTIRPNTLSASNPVTFISQYMPDLMIMAAMVYISGYQRNFGKQSDDPAMAQSFEGQYNALLKSTSVEEARKSYEAAAWSSMPMVSSSTPTRG